MYRANPAEGIAWVTGGSSGIGRGVARELVRRGYRVAVTARREAELQALAGECPGQIFVYPGDVTERAAMAAIFADIETLHGPVALAFLNAGANFRDAPGDPCGANFRATLDLNLYGVLHCLAPVVAAMQLRKRGQIAVTSSIAGYGGLPGAAAYCGSKAALIAMCQSLHVDLGLANITMQIVCPGYVRTPLTDKNAYPMPFMVELEDAVQHVCHGFERAGFEIAFPRRMVYMMKFVNMLPLPAYFWLMRNAGMRKPR